LIGRNFDILRLESFLAKYKAVEVTGELGVGKSSFIESAAKWLKSTKFVNKFIICDISRENITDVGSLTEWILAELSSFSKALSRKADGYSDPIDGLIQSLNLLSKRRILLVIDHLDDLHRCLSDDDIIDLNKLLNALWNNTVQPELSSTGLQSKSDLARRHYLVIIFSGILDGLTSKFTPQSLHMHDLETNQDQSFSPCY
jgi:hypothetical protein